MAPSTSFPGNVAFYLTLISFFSVFIFLFGSRAVVLMRGRWENRLGSPRDVLTRFATLPLLVLGTKRLNRAAFWYSGLLHSMIFWGFLVLQVRTFNFLLDGFNE